MDELIARWADIVGRIHGPLSFRLILQPAVAIFLAVRAGMHDAKEGRPPYFWTILTDPDDRRRLLREGWKAVARVFFLAIAMDVAYQLMVLRWVYPGEALFVAFLLACVPYLLVRGLVNRIVRGGGRTLRA